MITLCFKPRCLQRVVCSSTRSILTWFEPSPRLLQSMFESELPGWNIFITYTHVLHCCWPHLSPLRCLAGSKKWSRSTFEFLFLFSFRDWLIQNWANDIDILCQQMAHCTTNCPTAGGSGLEGFRHWLQLMCCACLLLRSEYFVWGWVWGKHYDNATLQLERLWMGWADRIWTHKHTDTVVILSL